MPQIYISKEIYDNIVKLGKEPAEYIAEATKEKLSKEVKK